MKHEDVPFGPSGVSRRVHAPRRLLEMRPLLSMLRCSSISALLALATSPWSVPAQRSSTLVVRGIVVDSASGAALAGASIEIHGQRIIAFSDAQGRFTLNKVAGGSLMLRTRLIGYTDNATAYQVERNIDSLRIQLAPNPVVLAALEVVTNRFESRRKAAGVSVRAFTTDQLAVSPAFDIYDFIRDGTGLALCPTTRAFSPDICVRYRGRYIIPRVFVDEVPLTGDVHGLRGRSKGEFYRIEIVKAGSEVWLYTQSFAALLAQGHAQLHPYIMVR